MELDKATAFLLEKSAELFLMTTGLEIVTR